MLLIIYDQARSIVRRAAQGFRDLTPYPSSALQCLLSLDLGTDKLDPVGGLVALFGIIGDAGKGTARGLEFAGVVQRRAQLHLG